MNTASASASAGAEGTVPSISAAKSEAAGGQGGVLSSVANPLSQVQSKVKDPVTPKPRQPAAEVKVAAAAAAAAAGAAEALKTRAVASLASVSSVLWECAAITPSGRLYPHTVTRRGEWHDIVNYGPSAGTNVRLCVHVYAMPMCMCMFIVVQLLFLTLAYIHPAPHADTRHTLRTPHTRETTRR